MDQVQQYGTKTCHIICEMWAFSCRKRLTLNYTERRRARKGRKGIKERSEAHHLFPQWNYSEQEKKKNSFRLQQLWRSNITLAVNKYTSRRHLGWAFVLLFWQVPLLFFHTCNIIITPKCTIKYKKWMQGENLQKQISIKKIIITVPITNMETE